MEISSGLRIIGSGGHATSVVSQVIADGIRVLGIHDDNPINATILGFEVSNLPKKIDGESFIVAVGDNYSRYKLSLKLLSIYGDGCIGTYVSSNSQIAADVYIPEGTVILSGAYVGPKSNIGQGVLLNTKSVVEHDCRLGPFASVAPGGILAGRVKLGEFSAVGIAAIVDATVSIGSHSLIGANSFCNKNIGDLSVAYGTPARVVREREVGEVYL